MSTTAADKPAPRRKGRSPNYPAFPLADAIRHAATLYDQENMHAVEASIACKHWKVKITSSSGLRYLSALQAFGLISMEGKGKGKKVRLTERGRTLARHPDTESSEYKAALREAALQPRLHREIWNEYKGKGWPSEDSFAYALEVEWSFHRTAIPAFIAEVRATFDLAGLDVSATVAQDEDDSDEDVEEIKDGGGSPDPKAKRVSNPPPPPPPGDPSTRRRGDLVELSAYTLKGGLRLVLESPMPLPAFRTLADIEGALLDVFKKYGIRRTDEEPDEPDGLKPGDLVQWTNGGVDRFEQPKRVERLEAGHVFVEGSSTGIPVSEVTRAGA